MSKKKSPSTHGQDDSGKFTKGNTLGRGNPLAGRAAKIRAVLLEMMTEDRARIIVAKLMVMAGKGDLEAIRELFNRTIGKPGQSEILERLERLEALNASRLDQIFEHVDNGENP